MQRSDWYIGLSTYLEALGFIRRNKLGYFFLFPILISLLVLVGLFYFKSGLIDYLNDLLSNWTGLDHTQDDLEGWTARVMRALVAVSIWIATTYIFWTFNKYIALVALSPVLAYLSEKTETILTGKEYPFSVSQLMNDAMRGAIVAIRNFAIEMLWIAGFTIVGLLFPPISPVLFIVAFIVSAYFYGFSMMDYTSERHRLNLPKGVRLVRRNRLMAVSNGALFDLLMRFPVLGITVAPILGCVGATLALHRKYNLNENLQNALNP